MPFYPNDRVICGATRHLKRCSDCNMVSYCGKSHQKQHWNEHKAICNLISTIQDEKKVSHIFQNLRGVDSAKWLQAKQNMLREVQIRLGRFLQVEEKQIFLFPRACFVCHDSRQELLTNCPRCPGASFCELHKSSFLHDRTCSTIEVFHKREIKIKEMGFAIEEKILQEILKATRKHELQKQPTSMRDYLDNHFKPPLEISETLKIHISEVLSLPLTIFSALEKVNLPPSAEIVIHLSYTLYLSCLPKYWETLLHLLPKLTALKIILIKHEVLANNKEISRMRVPLCEKCKSERKKVVIDSVMSSYVEYLNQPNYQIPNFVVVYDYEPMKKMDAADIKEQIEIWKKLHCHILFTTQKENKERLLRETLLSASDRFLIFYNGYNDFTPLRYIRDWEDGAICQESQFMIIFQKRNGQSSDLLDNRESCQDLPPNFFCASICHVCRSAKASTICNKCKMIFYCGSKHLKKHRLIHKELCKVILSINSRAGTTTLFDNLTKTNPELWLRTKVDLMKKAKLKLGRELRDFEEQMFLFPKTCFVCHESNLSLLRNCACGVSLCKIHKDDPKHKLQCKDLSIALKLIMIDQQPFPKLSIQPLTHGKNDHLPCSMQAFIDLYLKLREDIPDDLKKLSIPSIEKVLIYNSLTRPLTFIYALQKLNLQVIKSLIVHIIGATDREILEADYWEFVLYWLHKLKNLKITFIGPQVTNSILENEFEKPENREHKLEFPGKNFLNDKSVDLNQIQARYEEYYESESFEKPNIIFGFNLHIHESELGVSECSWKKTVLALSKLKVPFVITSGTKERARNDHKRLCSLLEISVNPILCEQNPFASLVPERDFETEGLKHSNNYISIYIKLSRRPKLNAPCLALLEWDPKLASFQLWKYNCRWQEPECVGYKGKGSDIRNVGKESKPAVDIEKRRKILEAGGLRIETKSSLVGDVQVKQKQSVIANSGCKMELFDVWNIEYETNLSDSGNVEHKTNWSDAGNIRHETNLSDAGNIEHDKNLSDAENFGNEKSIRIENTKDESGIEDMRSNTITFSNQNLSSRKETAELEIMASEEDSVSQSEARSIESKTKINKIPFTEGSPHVKKKLAKAKRVVNVKKLAKAAKLFKEKNYLMKHNSELREEIVNLRKEIELLKQKYSKAIEENHKIKDIRRQVEEGIRAALKRKK